MSRSNATHSSTPAATISTKRGRGRPPKTAKQPLRLPSSSPTLAIAPPKKRQKRRQAGSRTQGDIFLVKDIIGEKFIDGKRFFEIDWEDNPVNGEAYPTTWVCILLSRLVFSWD